MRTLLAGIVTIVLTLTLGIVVVVASLFGVPARADSIYERLAHWWVSAISRAAGARIVVHGGSHFRSAHHVFVANHVSWLDVTILASLLAHFRFVAKAEISRWPLFGAVFRSIGTVYIERGNRKAAFDSYQDAAERIRGGASVVVFPEGTRGTSYALRPFKKGPFVLAISAQAPVVPTVVHGTLEALPRGRVWVRGGQVDVHFLEPVPTAGLTYADRDSVAKVVHERMAELLEREYGVRSPEWKPRGSGG